MPTYYLGNTNADLSTGADFNKYLERATETQNTISFSVAKNSTETNCAYTRSGIPGNADWETGSITVEVYIVTADADVYLSVQAHRINSSGVVQESSTASSEQQLSTTGVKTFSIPSKDWTAGSSTDRLRIDYIFRNTSNNASLDIRSGTTDTEHTTSVLIMEYCAGTIPAVSNVPTNTLKATVKLIGTTGSTSTVSGNAEYYTYLSGVSPAVSSTSGVYTAISKLTSISGGSAGVSGLILNFSVLMYGSTGATSGVSPAFLDVPAGFHSPFPFFKGMGGKIGGAGIEVLVGTITATSGLAGINKSIARVSGSTSATALNSGILKRFRKVIGSTAFISSLSGINKSTVKIIGSFASTSLLSGINKSTVSISGSTQATSGLQGILKPICRVIGTFGSTSSLSAIAKIIHRVIGASGATSSLSGVSKSTVLVSGSTSATSYVAGITFGEAALRGSTSAVSLLSGSINVKGIAYCIGSTGAVTSLSGKLSAEPKLVSTIGASSGLSAGLKFFVKIVGQFGAVSGLSASVYATVPISGSIGSASLLSGFSKADIKLIANVSEQSSFICVLRADCKVVGIVTSTTTTLGALKATTLIRGAFGGISSLSGTYTSVVELISNVNAVSLLSGISKSSVVVVGLTSSVSYLAGISKSTVKVSGSFSGVSSVSGISTATSKLISSFQSTSLVSAKLSADVKLIGSTAGISGLSGTIVIIKQSLTGILQFNSSISGLLTKYRKVVGLCSPISSLSGIVRSGVQLVGSTAFVSSAAAEYSEFVKISGSTSCISGLAGTLITTAEQNLIGSIGEISTVSGIEKVTCRLVSSSSSVSLLSGLIEYEILISGTCACLSSLSGRVSQVVKLISSVQIDQSDEILESLKSESNMFFDFTEGLGNPIDKSSYANSYTTNATWTDEHPHSLLFNDYNDDIVGLSGDRDDISMHTSDHTLVMRVRFNRITYTNLETLIYNGAGGSGTSKDGYFFYRSNNNVRMSFSDGTAERITSTFIAPVVINDQRYHIILLEFDRDSGAYVYIDNIKSSTVMDITPQQGDVYNQQVEHIGGTGTANQNLDGNLSFVATVNRLLTEEEKINLFMALSTSTISRCSGVLKSECNLFGAVNSSSSLSAAIKYDVLIQSSIDSASVCSANLYVGKFLISSVSVESVVSGLLYIITDLIGSISEFSSISGISKSDIKLISPSNATALLSADLNVYAITDLFATIPSVSHLSATLFPGVSIKSLVSSNLTATGLLTVDITTYKQNYYLSNEESDLTAGSGFNNRLHKVPSDVGSLTVNIPPRSTKVGHGFTDINVPGNPDWEDGIIEVKLHFDVADANIYAKINVSRITYNGVVLESSGYTTEQHIVHSGLYLFYVNKNWTAGNISNRLRIAYSFRNIDTAWHFVTFRTESVDAKITTAIKRYANMSSSINPVASLSAICKSLCLCVGSSNSVANLSSTIARPVFVSGSFDGVSDLAGFTHAQKELLGALDSLSETSAFLRSDVPLVGSLFANSYFKTLMEGMISVDSDVIGQLHSSVILSGSIGSSSVVSAEMHCFFHFKHSPISCHSDVQATLTRFRDTAGTVNTESELTGITHSDSRMIGIVEADSNLVNDRFRRIVKSIGSIHILNNSSALLNRFVRASGSSQSITSLSLSISRTREIMGSSNAVFDSSAYMRSGVVLNGVSDSSSYVNAYDLSIPELVNILGSINVISYVEAKKPKQRYTARRHLIHYSPVDHPFIHSIMERGETNPLCGDEEE